MYRSHNLCGGYILYGDYVIDAYNPDGRGFGVCYGCIVRECEEY